MEKNKPTCIIPSRKGSKRLKNKGLQIFNGKPLVELAIEVALESELFICIVISSDDEKVLEVAYKYFNSGLVQPHLRPPGLAKDETPLRNVCSQIIQTYQTNSNDFCLLIPNSPFRTAEDLKKTYKVFKKKDANYLLTVKPYSVPPQMALKIKNGYLKPVGKPNLKQSQDLETLYYEDGSICWAKTNILFEEFDLNFYGSKCLPYILSHPTVDIDTKEDLEYAKYLNSRVRPKL